MTFCIGCGHQIHETAISCTQCGTVNQAGVAAQRSAATASNGSLWLPVPALVCGLIAALTLFSPSPWTQDEAMGVCLFAAIAMVLGGVGLARQKRGHGLFIAGIALGAIGLLGAMSAQL